ncbi:P-loop containing nucleoside triphosphate hydrolase protein [Didymella exigua CBS 183.55]|uniref:P-loop containing nucleoside triphosphate hydrolase protein n=1 Tax=Didymella exigua CBS 183.55 TaxID=1150837 RepID=A0A6A5RHX3_9PLEO|nr:P-loop containing nucleoside triphosphate hydrolase protein [Didymella exigua CBS 183.55]KAF1926840.1 P-loop containing nucleoside triphosphate hydrolase protein [Didymella exigua CBS 183.55]
MNLFCRQTWALVRKNWLLTCLRRPISTLFRAFLLPLVIILVLGYSKNFFSDSQIWGVSSPRDLLSLEAGLAASQGHDIVGFVDNGMKGGQVSSVIDSLSQKVRAAGKTIKLYNDTWDLALACRTDDKGISPCYGAVVFFSSPNEGTNVSSPGNWNYTIRALRSEIVNIKSTANSMERDMLPLQRALDQEIISLSNSTNTTQPLADLQLIAFTEQDQSALTETRNASYLSLSVFIFGPLFAFCLVEIAYHLTSFVSRERELGMSGLIDTMIPGGSNIRGRLVRQVATYVSFATIYFPGWLAVGIVLSTVVYPNFSRNMPLGFTILSGFALTGFSLFGASFFKKAQLSGSIMILIAVVFAILPVVLFDQDRVTSGFLSFLCPTANFSYFITGVGTFESVGKPVSMMNLAEEGDSTNSFRLPLYIHWILLIVHILGFPVLAFATEHLLFSTASEHRQFAAPAKADDATVTLSGFGKTYQPGFFARTFKRRKAVHAVTSLDFKAYPGQILCLLGPNGSGKSTTLNCIAGFQKVSSGNITIDSTGGLGYAPQHNVIWPELTVREHVKIFSDLKCLAAVNDEVVNSLVKGVDLYGKLPAQAKTLSGGQKRKLQLAMMFAGGSKVCCVDEVSTGLDPISRRRIWEILLAERSRRTIIMTTHFLDEADYLADDIAIMYKGALRASGTSASLKQTYGNGYTVKLPYQTDVEVKISEPIEKEQSRLLTVYRVSTGVAAAELVDQLERNGLHDYQLSGPTMEELFMKITGDSIHPTENKSESNSDESNTVALKAHNVTFTTSDVDYELSEGRPISAFQQWWLLFGKRLYILKRRWIPYFVAIVFALVGAAVAPLLIKSYNKAMVCPTPADLVNDFNTRNDFGNSFVSNTGSFLGDDEQTIKYVYGPASSLNESRLALMADIYSTNHTRSYSAAYPAGYSNSTEILQQMLLVDTYEEFSNAVRQNWKNQTALFGSRFDHFSPFTTLAGGIWMGSDTSKPTVMVNIRQGPLVNQMMNFYTVMASGVGISSSYYEFASTRIPVTYDMKALIFIVYYGLVMACYPVFFALYPTNERISNVRSMQYSNGIRPIPLWLSHLSFDGMWVILISAVATGLLTISTPVWHGMGLVFVIFVLYGIVCALLSYLISMFAKNAIAAWFIMALGQIILYFAYFGGLVGIQATTSYAELEHSMNALYFSLGIISPVISLERTLFIGLQQLALMCNGHPDNSVYMYGGPILYLAIQAILLFAILLWWDSGFVLPSMRSRTTISDTEATEMYNADLMNERKRLASPNTELRVENVSRKFGKNLAVDNVTFGVQSSEIFALLGPNGAGKSTIISMIRGDIKPSTSGSKIDVAGHSIVTSAVAARASLGVCPQFDSADALTVKETLRFFAKIRGVKDIDHNVSTVISVCGIEQWTDQLAQKLSGGTKRKLSLAVALVGNPRVLILDEPSSALDANAKRTLWRCLQTVAKRRAVLLTTHSMEEADALADRIGIVSSRMLALSGREELKRRAGNAYHIHIVSRSAPRTTPQELQDMREWVMDTFPSASISRETQGGQVRFEVPVEGNNTASLIRTLEAAKEHLGVEFYSVGKATLDEVFEKIVSRHGNLEV